MKPAAAPPRFRPLTPGGPPTRRARSPRDDDRAPERAADTRCCSRPSATSHPPVCGRSRRAALQRRPAVAGAAGRRVDQRAVALLLEQEDQGVAADSTEDLFLAQVMQQTALQTAVINISARRWSASRTTSLLTSLIYARAKLRHLDEAFGYFEEMLNSGHPPDALVLHLIMGCGARGSCGAARPSSGC